MTDFYASRKAKIASIAVLLFLFHFSVNWTLSPPHLRPDVIVVILEPLQELVSNGFASSWPQVNWYTGNPVFFLPFLEILGYSPTVFRLLLAASISLSTPLIFIGLERLYGYKRAVLLVLLLFNINLLLVFRYVDYAYTLPMASAIVGAFALWEDSRKDRHLYLFVFLSGLLMYFKLILLYISAGLAVGFLIYNRRDTFRIVTPDRFIAGVAVFLIGSSVFLAFGPGTDFSFINSATTDISDNYHGASDPVSIISNRLEHINYNHSPAVYLGQGKDIGVHWVSGLLAVCLLVTMVRPTRGFGYAYIAVFIFLLYVTNGMNFRQAMIILTLTPLVVGEALERINPGDRSIQMGALLLVLLLAVSLHELPQKRQTLDELPSEVSSADYQDYTALGLEGDVVTNYHTFYYLSKYDLSTESIFLVEHIQVGAPRENAILRRGREDISQFKHTAGARNTTYVLLDGEAECGTDPRTCGYKTGYIEQEMNLSDFSVHTVAGRKYRVYR